MAWGNFSLGSKSTLCSLTWKGLVTAKTTDFRAGTLQDVSGRIRDATNVGSAVLGLVSIFTPKLLENIHTEYYIDFF